MKKRKRNKSDFEPVTGDDMQEIKEHCLEKNVAQEFDGQYEPQALKAMLIAAIGGEFDESYKQLEEAYNNRRTELNEEFYDDLANAQEDLVELEKEIKVHSQLFNKYQRVHQELVNDDLPSKLFIDEAKVQALRNKIEEIKQRKERYDGKK